MKHESIKPKTATQEQPKLVSNEGTTNVRLVSAQMGYGHLRAIFPLQHLSSFPVLTVGSDSDATASEGRLWKKTLWLYEFLSRAKGIPVIGGAVFKILDFFLQIPSYYPYRDLSHSTFQVRLLHSSIKKGLCKGMLEKTQKDNMPLVTSFYAPALAADMEGRSKIYCIICDTDLNRVWVSHDPWESRIEYFAPSGRAARRLQAYGVPESRIHLTGFPLPLENLGSSDLDILKHDLGQRLHYLDPNKRFWPLHSRNIEHFIGTENCHFKNDRKLTITFAVGGAGAQKQIARRIAFSLVNKLLDGSVILNLAAGTRKEVKDYFFDVKEDVASSNINIIYDDNFEEYYKKFNQALRTTDVLWTKPSELSFYCGLGIPIIMTPTIGAQEKANKKWLKEIQAGLKQENPDYTEQWLFDLLNKGRLAEAAWAGFIKARKRGTYNITDYIKRGYLKDNQHLIR